MYMFARLILFLAAMALIAAAGLVTVAFHPWSTIIAVLYVFRRMVKTAGGLILTGHGTARFASLREIARAGMFTGKGLILGRVHTERPSLIGAYFRLIGIRKSRQACVGFLSALRVMKPDTPLVRMPPKNVHTVVFAPTGAGKGVSFVIPFLLTCPDSAIVIDLKGELYNATARARRRMGGEVHLLDPYRVVSDRPDRLNPLDFIRPDSPTAPDDCRALADAFVVRQGTEPEPYWNDAATVQVGAVTGFVVTEGAKHGKANLQIVRNILSLPEQLKVAREAMKASPAWDGILARWAGQMELPGEKERGSILGTANRHMAFLDSRAVAESVSSSTFNPHFRKQTIYLVIPPDKLAINTGLLRMWITTLLRQVVKQGLNEKRLVHCVLDESAALGKMEVLSDALDKLRAFGVRLQFYYQSVGQLNRCWPEDQGQTLLANCAAVYFGVNDHATAKAVSERLGNMTVALEGGSSGTNDGRSRPTGGFAQDGGSNSYGSNESTSWTQSARALNTPDEVMRLPQRTAITFPPGMPPVMTTLVRYYEEPLTPGLVRRTFGAVKVLLLSVIVLCVAVLLALAVANLDIRAGPENIPAPKATRPSVFGDNGGK